jgi:hypothetical protein
LLALTYSITDRIDERYDLLDKMEEKATDSLPLDKFIKISLTNMKRVSATDEELTLFLFVTYLEQLYARDRLNELTGEDINNLLKMLVELKDLAKRDLFVDLDVACNFLEIALKRRIRELNPQRAKQGLYKVMSSKIEFEMQWHMYASFELADILYNEGSDLEKAEQHLRSCYNYTYAAEDLFGGRITTAIQEVVKARVKK